jgi:predicted Zn-dependent peptidase
MTYDLFGIDQNYIFDFKKKVGELTSMDILEAAKRHLHPGEQPILVVVDASKISSSLQKLGKQVVFLHPDYLR